jgi:holo-[acyl-carrier protein] synthase
MILGVGTDLCQISRIVRARQRRGMRFDERILTADELARLPRDPSAADRYVAKRFAAKEALGKALGTGIRAPMAWHAASVINDSLGRPLFSLTPALTIVHMPRDERAIALSSCTIHLSLTDDGDYAMAYVIIEHRTST